MKRAVIFIAIILVAGGGLFAKKHRAEAIKNHLPPVVLTDPAVTPDLLKPSKFADSVDLWGDPWGKADSSPVNYSSLTPGNDRQSARFETLQPRAETKTDPLVTVQNQQLDYNLFDLGGFKLNLNFKPSYPTPEALLPTRIDPGISGSFSF